ncbi:glycerophosphodiester phosphodiesterase domain-containing protein 5-like [Periophthalmus magnuspinnatus]|uniref:glycerophosphodiester phosphodiesterase domain-containing protein 5-like n=1 Tax=Periophthalmus magnuspinnatus TaxID=409849 RepID=UPI00145C0E37|nr:glycerophosphodiester phosphodiesterase domain-containing protein 5-like [Periophthalmus magnuspinnatus]
MEGQLQFGRVYGLRSRLLRRYKHGPLVWCVKGLYGCHWGPQQRSGPEPGDCGCSKVEVLSLALLTVAFCITLVFLYFWGQAKNDYNDFDWFTFGALGFWFPWSVVLLAITAAFFTYLTALMLLLLCLLSERQRISLHWVHKVAVSVVLLFSVAAISVLSDLWSREWTTLLLSFQVTAPYLHMGGVLLMTALSWPVAVLSFQMTRAVQRALILGLFLLLLSALYLVPLGLYSPCIKDKDSLGPPPALIGHRGAPMLAPENTLMAFEKAVQCGCAGLETDVTLSLDGVPFLMHDRTLLRTTDVQQQYPERSRSPAAMFSWSQLRTLNAGAWFLSSNPFRTAGSLPEDERLQAQNQSICSLVDFLQLAAHSQSLVIFDLYRPPKGHPYRDTWVQRTLDVLLNQSSILSSQVLWLPSDLRSLVQEIDPDLQQTSGSQLPLQELQSNNIVKLNLHYSAMSPQLVREYQAVNISVNLYVVSEPWLYSVAWCSGVQSLTTNAPQRLSTMTQPLLLMSPGEYSLMWTLTDLLSLALVLLVFCFHWWREQALALSSEGDASLDTGTYSKFRTELSEVWSVSSVNSHIETTTSDWPLTHGCASTSQEPPSHSPRPSNMSSTRLNRVEPAVT